MKIYNTLSRRKEDFVPQGDPVKMYVCGITPYDQCHVGHAMSYIIFDVLRRYLEWRGYQILQVQNFTDVDDKLIQRAAAIGRDTKELAEELIQGFFVDMDALNVQRAHVYPRATEEIPHILDMVSSLVDKGYAYPADGDVYFRVERSDGYGKLSHRSLEGMTAGYRVEVDPRKEHPMDFTLWKAAKPGEPSWESPWGMGRPGWHIECSAMSLKYLGITLDIHGGGQDLIFPHHENEIAQAEAHTGVSPFVRYWVHHGLLQLDEEKMSKSLGNLVTVKEVLSRCSPDALRLFVLGSHYRSPLTYSDDALRGMERGAARLRNAAKQATPERNGSSGISSDPYKQRFLEAMEDDFNTAQAIAALFDLAKEINKGREEGIDINEAVQVLRELSGVLGLTLEEPELALDAAPFRELLISIQADLRKAGQDAVADRVQGALRQLGVAGEETPPGNGLDSRGPQEEVAGPEPGPFIEALLSVRMDLRGAKQYELADGLRARLDQLGVTLEDTPRGTVWKLRQRGAEP
ncbi:MAG: cysteine--tRNA ligase [Dehalococcoidia bacterium]